MDKAQELTEDQVARWLVGIAGQGRPSGRTQVAVRAALSGHFDGAPLYQYPRALELVGVRWTGEAYVPTDAN